MEWRKYSECCHKNALDLSATFCADCGASFLRCLAYAECFSLVEPLTPCRVCVAPELYIDKNAVTNTSVGHQLTIPLVLRNTSSIERPIWATRAMMRRGSDDFRPLDLPWERVGAGDERAFFVETGALEAGGTGVIEIEMAFGTRYKGYEEQYLYGGAIRFSSDTPSDSQIVQNIDLSGAQFGTGGMVHVPTRMDSPASAGSAASTDRVRVPFDRYERREVEWGLRGYSATGRLVPRTADFRLIGFPARHAPSTASIGSRGVLVFGRNSRDYDDEQNPDPSDVVLRVTDPRTGKTDREASFAVSRRHFDLMNLNNRLCLFVRSSYGVLVNGKQVTTSTLHDLNDGDIIQPLIGNPEALAIRLAFEARPDGIVETVRIERLQAG